MRRISFLAIVFLPLFIQPAFSQNAKKELRNSVLIGAHRAILGDGDYIGTIFTNQYAYRVFPFLEVSSAFEFLTSSKFRNELPKESYQSTQLLGNILVHIVPVNSKRFHIKLGGGISLRSRKSVASGDIFFDDIGYVESIWEKESSFDVGYALQPLLGINITPNVFVDARLSLQNYDQGTQLVVYGLLAGYQF